MGEEGCGKSAAIMEGLKAYKLAEPVMTMDCPEGDVVLQCGYTVLFYRTKQPIACLISDTLREGKVADDQGTETVLNVLEVDNAILKARLEFSHEAWPKRAPPLDGVIVCCDVSRKDSFAAVEDLLRLSFFLSATWKLIYIAAFRDARLPIVAIACKCDLDNVLDLNKLHGRLTKLDIGLIKVTIANEEGKCRLRLAFNWLLRAISYNRRPLTQFSQLRTPVLIRYL